MTRVDSRTRPALSLSQAASAPAPAALEATAPALDLKALFTTQYASVWRLLRRLRVPSSQLDDAAQEVFWVAARRLGDIRAGSERAFLYGVALRVAQQFARRDGARAVESGGERTAELATEDPDPEQRLVERRARELLDQVLDRLPLELRTVLVLFELEGLSVRDIAELEGIPQGTVASRLRRAREEFSASAKRVRGALDARGARR